ncbi:hypothetical protein ACFVJW_09765 [Streptomyces libani]
MPAPPDGPGASDEPEATDEEPNEAPDDVPDEAPEDVDEPSPPEAP